MFCCHKPVLNSLKENDEEEEPGLNETNDPGETIIIINQYEEIIKSHNKRVTGCLSKQGEIRKEFREAEDFTQNVGEKKLTIYYKIGMHKFFNKYPFLKNSTLLSNYIRNNFKAIKTVCKKKRKSNFIDNKTNKVIIYH